MTDGNEQGRGAFATYQDNVVGQRGLWPFIRYELFTMLFMPLPGAVGVILRQRMYRWLVGSMGKGVAIGRSVTLRGPSKIHLDGSVVLDDYADLNVRGNAGSIRIGEGTFVGRGTSIRARDGDIEIGPEGSIGTNCRIGTTGHLRVGRYALIAAYCAIGGGNHPIDDVGIPMVKRPAESTGVTIGDDVWLGTHAVVLDGVSIGRGAVIGAGAVVTKDVPEFAIVAGVPARVLGYREAAELETSSRVADAPR